MARAPWSLTTRLTRYAVLTTVGTVAVCAGLSAWFLRGAVAREVEALVNEELEEMTVSFMSGRLDDERFEKIAGALAAEHPNHPMAWAAVLPDGTRRFSSGPDHLLLAAVPGQEIDPPLALGSRPMTDDLTLVFVLDASEQYAALSRYGGISLALVGAFGLVAVAGGALFARSVGRRLENVSGWIRDQTADPLTATPANVEGAPEEIRGITTALTDLLSTVRSEQARANLLMTGMAHELRSPIQNLLGQAEIALLRERDAGEYRSVLTSQREELRRFARVVDNLVTLCASGQSEARRTSETFDLGEEARLRLAGDSDRAKRAGVELEIDYSGDLVVEGDREAILLALGNLVGNAIDWSPEGGKARVQLASSNGHVRLTVDDAGPGVPPAERERIFEPFYHGPSPDGARAGFGLGLALTRSAALAHGGEVHVGDSALGGARFEIVLPSSKRDSAQRSNA